MLNEWVNIMDEKQKILIDVATKNIVDRSMKDIIKRLMLESEKVETDFEKSLIMSSVALRESVSLSVQVVLFLLESQGILTPETGKELQRLLMEAFSEANGL